MATHSSILIWRIPRSEEPGGLQSIRSQSQTRLKRLSTHAQLKMHDKDSVCLCAKSFQLCPTLCDPMDRSLPGSFVHGILQARVLEWVLCSFPEDIANPGVESASLMSPSLAGGSLPLALPQAKRHLSTMQINECLPQVCSL